MIEFIVSNSVMPVSYEKERLLIKSQFSPQNSAHTIFRYKMAQLYVSPTRSYWTQSKHHLTLVIFDLKWNANGEIQNEAEFESRPPVTYDRKPIIYNSSLVIHSICLVRMVDVLMHQIQMFSCTCCDVVCTNQKLPHISIRSQWIIQGGTYHMDFALDGNVVEW